MNVNLLVIKEQFIKTERFYAKAFKRDYNDSWKNGLFILRPTLTQNFGFLFLYNLLDENSNDLIKGESDLLAFDTSNDEVNNILLELKAYFKQGIVSKIFNEIQIKVENKEFTSFVSVWNQDFVDKFDAENNFAQPHRSKYNAKFKPWYLDQGNFTELPAQEIHITNTVEIYSFASLTNYLKGIASSTKDLWDCTFLTFQVSDFSSLHSVTKEEYVYLDNQDTERDKPHAYIQEIKFSSEDLKKIFEGFKAVNLWDAYTIGFQMKADGTFDYYVLDGYKKWINGRDVDPKSYEAFEKEMADALNQELNQNDQPITSDYLLQNIYGCISANVLDDFASLEAVITRSFDGDTQQQLSGSYSYKPKGLFSSSKSVEPGEQIYPINLTIRLLDEFYTEESKDWRKAVLTFKNDGTCNVKIGK